MLVSPLPSSFLDTYNLSTSSLGCNALHIVLWSICLSSSLIPFNNGPEYLTRRTAQLFIPLIRFLLNNLASWSFLNHLKYSFLIFSFISTCLIVSASKMPNYLYVFFSPSVLILSWFGSSIPSVGYRFPLFISSMPHFFMPNSIPMPKLYFLTTCIRVFN